MEVAVTGSHGLIGSALVASLRASGHRVRRVVRVAGTVRAGTGHAGRAGAQEVAVRYHPDSGELDAAALEGVDAVVNLAGEPIAPKPFTAEHKRAVIESRVTITRALVRAIAQLDRPPATLLSGSAIGVYGAHRGDEVLTEASSVGNDFLANVCTSWEAAALDAAEHGTRVVLARTGLVLSSAGGALRPLLAIYKLGLGGPAGPGTQWQSWITLADEVAALRFLLESEVEGPVNLVSPHPVRNAEFAATLGRVLHRPAKLRIPALLTRAPAPLAELFDNLLFASQRVHPNVLTAAGFRCGHADLAGALQAVLSR